MSDHRNTIFLESAKVLAHESFDGDQHVLRLDARKAAAAARPGSFAHLRCDESVPMRRPLSIMRADPAAGWIELLYKPVGAGLRRLVAAEPGDELSVLAPIGNGFSPDPSRPRIVAIGGGVGIPPILFLAETLAPAGRFETFVLMGSEVPFPFALAPARLALGGLGACWAGRDVRGIAALEAIGVPSATSSNAGLSGALAGYVTDAARDVLSELDAEALAATQVAACGPGPMLQAVARLAADFRLPCQLALEEYMACGVGGCAGCTVPVHGPEGVAMKRVCVDGPVFEAGRIYPSEGVDERTPAVSRN